MKMMIGCTAKGVGDHFELHLVLLLGPQVS